jgi:hypothetical protein
VNDNEDRSFIAAFDARSRRAGVADGPDGEASNWATPFVWQNERRTEIVTTGTKKVARTTRAAVCSGSSPA